MTAHGWTWEERTLQALIARYELVLLAGWLARLSERTWTPEEFLGDVDMARAGSRPMSERGRVAIAAKRPERCTG